MLIVAQPKTASSSLLEGLKQVSNLPGIQQFSLAGACPWAKGYAMRCTDMVEIDAKILSQWLAPNRWNKQHFLPTENNVALLAPRLRRGAKIAILLRDVDDCLQAVLRVPGSDFIKRMQRKQLPRWRDTLIRFNSRWRHVASMYPKNILVVDFEDFVNNEKVWVDRILRHYGRPERCWPDFRLPRIKYSRGGKQEWVMEELVMEQFAPGLRSKLLSLLLKTGSKEFHHRVCRLVHKMPLRSAIKHAKVELR